MIGREDKNNTVDIQIPCEGDENYISRKHCRLCYSVVTQSYRILPVDGPVYVMKQGMWQEVPKGETYILPDDTPFRLVPPSIKRGTKAWDQFILKQTALPCTARWRPGSETFDHQYLKLLRLIKEQGKLQNNKKGESTTLSNPFTFEISLFHPERKLLPTTSLRKIISGGLHAVYEAIWYLRGEDHVRFLQNLKCRFWDKQAGPDGFVGLSYGLLVNYNSGGINQLLEYVIKPLCEGKYSRNMTCSLIKPDEVTCQKACTSSVQFSVEPADTRSSHEYLNLTVNQRSSDVILGLPHDVIAWATILHLVCDDVWERSNGKRKLKAGKLYFQIAGGGSHVYQQNETEWNELLQRTPKSPPPETELQILKRLVKENDIFTFAKNFESGHAKIVGYNNYHGWMKIQQAV
eukprot:scaffold8896_cov162-Amphora_coffeaeformis.AAC.1